MGLGRHECGVAFDGHPEGTIDSAAAGGPDCGCRQNDWSREMYLAIDGQRSNGSDYLVIVRPVANERRMRSKSSRKVDMKAATIAAQSSGFSWLILVYSSRVSS
jgi:hypothetical protein